MTCHAIDYVTVIARLLMKSVKGCKACHEQLLKEYIMKCKYASSYWSPQRLTKVDITSHKTIKCFLKPSVINHKVVLKPKMKPCMLY